ncbi:MAG: hypothetical protein PF485_02745 [Bacteroidales bacterium]|jgi:hypothetical protein|nr:hypothetical protein [Bacteroidales bacterium]
MTKKVNKASTKVDIWEAYNELQEQLKEKAESEPQKAQVLVQEKEVVKTASALSSEKTIKDIAELKMALSSSLDSLEDRLTSEYRKLEILQKAIELENKSLEDLYGIKSSAHSLAALHQTQQEKKESFENEMAETKISFDAEIKNLKEQWAKEVEKREYEQKEKKADFEKIRKREEEEYLYKLALNRKKEEDTFQEKKALSEKQMIEKQVEFDKSIAERESVVAASEKELAELKAQVEKFPTELNKSVQSTEKALAEKLTTQFDFEKQLAQKQVEGEQKLNEQTVASLHSRIKELELSVKELNSKTTNAESSVKDIALKAIESSSKLKIIESSGKKDQE